MKPQFRRYESGDFAKIRQFLIDSYTVAQKPHNITLERWNFGYSMDRSMHNISEDLWSQRVGIWEISERIVGTVHGEGPGSFALIQTAPSGVPAETIGEMLTFAEQHIAAEEDGQLTIQVNIPEDDDSRKAVAARRGYRKSHDTEPFAKMPITSELPRARLPAGYSIKPGKCFGPDELGRAHARAFGYIDEPTYVRRSSLGYERMQQTPDYDPALDLYVVSNRGGIASFCTIWLDETNRMGILEPVGTDPDHRRKGLGRSVIYECISRVAARGATAVWVGSEQSFYLSIGFECVYRHEIWEKYM